MKQISFLYRRMLTSKKFINICRKFLLIGLVAFFATIGLIDVCGIFSVNCFAENGENTQPVQNNKVVFPNYNQGLEYLKQGEYEKAIESFEKALKNNENNLDSHYRLANIYYLIKGDSEKSRYHFDEYTAILMSLDEAGQVAERDFYELDDENTVKAKQLFEESTALAASNNIAEAKEKLQQAVELTPGDPVMLYNLGVMHHKLGEVDEAVKNYLKSIEIKVVDDSVYLSLAIAYQQKGDNVSAVDYYQKTLDYNSANIIALNNLAVLLEQAGMLNDAIERYNQIIELDPSYKRAYNNLASIYARQEDFDNAKKYFEQAIQIDPSYLDPHYNLGMIYEQQGNIEKALEEFRFVCLNDAQYPNLGKKIAKLEAGRNQSSQEAEQLSDSTQTTEHKQVKRQVFQGLTPSPDNETVSFKPDPFEVDYKHLKQELRNNPLSYKANKDVIEFLREHKMYDKALAFAEDARDKLKDNPEMLVLAADTAVDKKYFYRAIKEYEEILNKYPEMKEIHYKLSLVYVDKNNPLRDSQKALAHYKKYMKSKESASSSNTN